MIARRDSFYLSYTEGFQRTGNLREDVERFFRLNEDADTLEHTLAVASEANRIAGMYGFDAMKCVNAALLHDISNVIPVSAMLDAADELDIEVLDVERKYDRSVHQKLSKRMAIDLFGIEDEEILSAIESHTTHRAGAGNVGKALFAADKISWNLPGEHPYLLRMRELVDRHELDRAILVYVDHIWSQRDKLKLVHPWLIEAKDRLESELTQLWSIT